MHDHVSASGALTGEVLLAVPFACALVFYGCGVVIQHRRGRPWSWRRSASWSLGVATAAAGFVGPLADGAHGGFTAHMAAHVCVGMLAPLLLVQGAPVTLALRSLSVVPARRLTRLLSSPPARLVTTPIVAALFNVGGLWVLYATPLQESMQADPLVHLAIMAHFLLAGYLFTAAIIPVDPAPHRAGFPLRMGVVVAALAAHGILAKTLYAHPPAGVGTADAQAGAMLMYYAGDVVDAAIIALLCAQWYRHGAHGIRRATLRSRAVPSG